MIVIGITTSVLGAAAAVQAEACATSAHNQLIVFPVGHVLVRDLVLGCAVRAQVNEMSEWSKILNKY